MQASLIQPVRKENGFKVFNENSNEEFLEIYTTNGVESINVELKIWFNFLLKNSSLLLKRLSTLRSINTMKPLAEHVTSASACHSDI